MFLKIGRKTRLLGSTAFGGGASRALSTATFGAMLLVSSHKAQAFNLYDGLSAGNNLEINLNTTISYTPIIRVGTPSKSLTSSAGANVNDGDLNFQHGLVSNEFEILPILDIRDGNFGAHFSGEAYLNTSYLTTNQNDQPFTNNSYSIAKNTDFTSATRNVDGMNARVLDAFVYGQQRFGADDGQSVTVKVGRQTLLWGQSLFLANNGIAGGMAPIDVNTALENPNAETQQIIEPVGQVVLTYQPTDVVTLQGYYQFEWERDYFPGVGAYFSTQDIGLNAGQRLILAPGAYLFRAKDLTPPINNGQFGASLQLTLGNYDVGLYGLRFDTKTPYFYGNFGAPALTPGGFSLGTYRAVFGRDVWLEGTSVSTTVGPVNVAAEISFRQHMMLASGLNLTNQTANTNANSNPAYPTGDTFAGQTSIIYVSPGIPLDPGGVSFAGEVGFNHVLAVTANNANILSASNGSLNRSSTAAQFQFVVTPTYYNVAPNLQLNFPIGLAYGFYGRSMVDTTENNGTGTFNLGVAATYKVSWIASATFNDYIGAPKPLLDGEPVLADRNYLLLNLQHSF